jgi:hypothetical protein
VKKLVFAVWSALPSFLRLPGYKPPTRKLFAGLLLATNFGEYRGRMHGRIAMQVDTFDLRLIGDGATAKRMPLVNMLAAGFMNFRGS